MKQLYILVFLLLTSSLFPQQPVFSQVYDLNASFLSIELFGQNGYLCCGINPFSSTNNYTITNITSDGRLAWEYIYDIPRNSPRLHQAIAADGDTALMFIVPRIDDGLKYLQLVKMNNKGETIFTKNILQDYYCYMGIVKRNNNEFATATILHDSLSLILFNSAGNVTTEYHYKVYGLLTTDAAFSIINTTDGGMLISAYKSTIKVDSNYQQVWMRHEGNVFYSTKADSNNFVSLYDGKIIKYDSNGNVIWWKHYGIKPISILYTPSGDYLLPYRIFNRGNFLTKLNSNGDSVSSVPARGIITAMKLIDDNAFIMSGELSYPYMSWITRSDISCEHKIVDFEDYLLDNRLNIFSYIKLYWYTYNVQSVDIDYSTDNGANWINIAQNLTAPPYIWSVPNTPSDECLFKVRESGSFQVYDVSTSMYSFINYKSYDYIAANNVLMWAGNNGDGSHNPNTDGNGFYWPGGINNDGKSAIFEDGLLWGGKLNGEIRVNGNTHRQGIKPGVILPNGKASDPYDPKYRIYKIKKGWADLPDTSIEKKIYEYNYNNWAGDIGAEYNDVNDDGVFTPGMDAPKFLGDEVLYYTANDLDTATTRYTYGSDPIGLEFHTSIFAFNTTDALADAVFKKYVLINKSGYTIDDMYLLYWSDDDLGDANDDRSAIDTNLCFTYTYNSDNDDGIYGTAPPAVAHMLLQSPIIRGSITDSAFYQSHWRKNFKNIKINAGGMLLKHRVMGFPGNPVQGLYLGSLEYYNLMMGLANDGTSIKDPITNEITTFCVPGDPVGGTGWYYGAGWPNGPGPGDSYNYLSCGPFTIAPGDTQEVVYAIFIAKGSSNLNSITKLRESAAFIRDKFYKNFPGFEDEVYSIPEIKFEVMQNYPNPFNPSTKIRFSVPFDDNGTPSKKNVTIKIYDILGREIKTILNSNFAPGNYETIFNASSLASGVYFYRLEAGSFMQTKKMVLLR
ncbi:MAG: T9SS type A sorting domain-containing protein [Ignavibacteriaceae bacterium]|nr:T9SS type A sorting domain-containing protein [Ignavibacteriaceae bacterium]